ncbi:hypothetical protein CPAV1605_94 [seawater metagenome]|uniref:Uncharacterized protein n=1 Tax=seawater metagenome TaxID=1561972 RepID=A0A5E8CL52_9ZZZZ
MSINLNVIDYNTLINENFRNILTKKTFLQFSQKNNSIKSTLVYLLNSNFILLLNINTLPIPFNYKKYINFFQKLVLIYNWYFKNRYYFRINYQLTSDFYLNYYFKFSSNYFTKPFLNYTKDAIFLFMLIGNKDYHNDFYLKPSGLYYKFRNFHLTSFVQNNRFLFNIMFLFLLNFYNSPSISFFYKINPYLLYRAKASSLLNINDEYLCVIRNFILITGLSYFNYSPKGYLLNSY